VIVIRTMRRARLVGGSNSKHLGTDMAMIRRPFFGRDSLPAPKNEVGLFVPVEEVFPGMTTDEGTLLSLLR
jgi:hypothetical protein